LNAGPNDNRFNLLFHNCADFARAVLNSYYPHAIHRSFFSDAGLTTPKQAAKCWIRYSRKHDDLEFSSLIIPQIGGTLPRSHKTRGVVESLLRSKKYAVPLALLHPVFIGSLAIAAIAESRLDPTRNFTQGIEKLWQPESIAAQLQANGATASEREVSSFRPALHLVNTAAMAP
jgi:hypothetical protein